MPTAKTKKYEVDCSWGRHPRHPQTDRRPLGRREISKKKKVESKMERVGTRRQAKTKQKVWVMGDGWAIWWPCCYW